MEKAGDSPARYYLKGFRSATLTLFTDKKFWKNSITIISSWIANPKNIIEKIE